MYHPVQFSELQTLSGLVKQSKSRESKSAAAGTPTITGCFEKDRKYGKGSREHKSLTDAVTRCIVTDMLPISIVDNDGFRELVSKLNPDMTCHIRITSADLLFLHYMK